MLKLVRTSTGRAVAHRLSRWMGLLWLAAMPAFGASLTAQLDRDVVPLGETVTLSLIFEGASPGAAPTLPPLPNLRVQPAGQSSEFSIVNGQTTSKQTYNYVLTAAQLGEIFIPPLQITVSGATLTSQPLRLKVVQSNAATTPSGSANTTAFLKLIVPKTNVYVGEPFPVEMHLYWQQAQDIRAPQLKAEGFSLGPSARPAQSVTQAGGVPYNLAVFKTSATAAKAGTLTLGPAECSLALLVPLANSRRRDPFDAFSLFGPRMEARPTTLTSETNILQVLPLPSQDVPESFNGAVGQFSLQVTASPTDVAVGDPITVRAVITGRGLIDSLTLPPQTQWRDFKVYPPNTAVESNDPLGLSGTKFFTNAVIPLNHEIKVLPPLQFTYFDPNARRYRTLSSPAVPLKVRPNASVSPPPPLPTNSATAQANAPPADDIIPIRARLDQVGPPVLALLQRPWFLVLQGVPAAAWLSLLVRRKRQESLAKNPRLRRQREVALRVREGLASLREAAAANQSDEFFAVLFRVLQEQLGERLDLPASAITEAVIEERLRQRHLPEETLSALHELFQTCNLARYAPLKTSQELAALIPRLESVLRDLQQLRE